MCAPIRTHSGANQKKSPGIRACPNRRQTLARARARETQPLPGRSDTVMCPRTRSRTHSRTNARTPALIARRERDRDRWAPVRRH